MTVEYAVRSLIIADATLLGLLGSRLYPAPLPEQPTYPALIYQQISDVNYSSHQGSSNLARTRLQLTIWGNSYDSVKVIRDNLKRVLRDFRGTVGGDRLDRIIWANDIAQPDPDTRKQMRLIDLEILHDTQY